MQHNDTVYIRHAIDAAEKAIEISQEISKKDLHGDDVYSLALIRLLEIIGEAANHVSKKYKLDHPEVPWSHMIGMRNRLIHGYFDIDIDIVWDTVNKDLPPLVSLLKKIL
ncbi:MULTISPECIES: HepT-like ribonuclease domain-containing protein [Methanocalculus]|uniref:HepT-like ribonuclease domain-containing protein n=1 Tax=Methanocalculus TaxID=71151 RepID=UPI00209D3330|nr:DUF86 domain-containing protein [Methanocalculus sp. AMF5]MCP1663158.1 uncharacterized protein with HEPN domain [Methanocalculus sp. AMF5]